MSEQKKQPRSLKVKIAQAFGALFIAIFLYLLFADCKKQGNEGFACGVDLLNYTSTLFNDQE